jgi:VanZ family protein
MLNFILKHSRALFFSWLILIIIASSIPQLPTPKIKTSGGSSFRLDYLIHFLEFFILTMFFISGWVAGESRKTFLFWFFVLNIGIMCTFFAEIYQLIIPGRRFNIFDCYFNTLGLVTGMALWGFFKRKSKWFSNETNEKYNE